jgi:endo-1,4-beta-xylanase
LGALSGDDPEAKQQAQREEYKTLVGLCVAEPACEAVTFWGFTDAHTWLDAFFPGNAPLLFDSTYAKKPAFWGVVDAFAQMAR